MGVRKRYPPELKAKVVLEILKETKSISEISSEYGIHPNQLMRWRNQAIEGLPRLFSDEGKALESLKSQHEKEVQELYGEIGRLTTELTWLKKRCYDTSPLEFSQVSLNSPYEVVLKDG